MTVRVEVKVVARLYRLIPRGEIEAELTERAVEGGLSCFGHRSEKNSGQRENRTGNKRRPLGQQMYHDVA